ARHRRRRVRRPGHAARPAVPPVSPVDALRAPLRPRPQALLTRVQHAVREPAPRLLPDLQAAVLPHGAPRRRRLPPRRRAAQGSRMKRNTTAALVLALATAITAPG